MAWVENDYAHADIFSEKLSDGSVAYSVLYPADDGHFVRFAVASKEAAHALANQLDMVAWSEVRERKDTAGELRDYCRCCGNLECTG